MLDIVAYRCQSLGMPSGRDTSTMPSLGDLAAWWADSDRQPTVEELFPDLRAWWIGWGEPFCFGCGWVAPINDGPRAWYATAANSWLERAHLKDHCFGGSDQPDNIVPLCTLCHDAMPPFRDRDAAAAWVRDKESDLPRPWAWQMWTDGRYFDRKSKPAVPSRKARAYRLKAEYLTFMVKAESYNASDGEIFACITLLIKDSEGEAA